MNTISKIAIAVAAPTALYVLLIGALMTPPLQRLYKKPNPLQTLPPKLTDHHSALYAHKFNTLFWHNINDAEQFGFAKNQVTPFNIQTPDGETLYAWHVLPLDVYAHNERKLRSEERPLAPVDDLTATNAFKLLTEDPDARVVVSCKHPTTLNLVIHPAILTIGGKKVHGNAGHIAQGWRTDTFRYLSTQSHTHVFTIDYRGFGHSTGSPTEAGLITDGVALVNWVLQVANIPPERIVILGQSLGTAVASAVGLEFASPKNELHPRRLLDGEQAPLLMNSGEQTSKTTAFAGIVLVAPFSNLPSLMLTYRLGGIFPLLLPLRPFPSVATLLTRRMVDKWPTADRLRAYYDSFATHPELLHGAGGRGLGSLQLLHAVNDLDISYHQTEMICEKMFGESETLKWDCRKGGPRLMEVKREGRPAVRIEILGHGAHNRVVTYSPVSAAVFRAFEDVI